MPPDKTTNGEAPNRQWIGGEPVKPLQSARTAATVRVRHGKVSITDGPFAETKETVGGFFVIEAADRDEAITVASRWPSARLGSIEVRPLEAGLNEERRYG
jgi:hypothetical protein